MGRIQGSTITYSPFEQSGSAKWIIKLGVKSGSIEHVNEKGQRFGDATFYLTHIHPFFSRGDGLNESSGVNVETLSKVNMITPWWTSYSFY
jgi:hypothetical protein